MKINISSLWQSLGIEDKAGLVQQLYDAYYGEVLVSGDIIHVKGFQAEQYVRNHSKVCGFHNEETLKEITEFGAITPIDHDRSRFPYYDKTIGTNVYKVLIDWEKVGQYAGFLQDHEANDQYGFAQQKQIIRKTLQELDKKSKYKDLVISEKILGKYLDHASIAQAVHGDDSPDRHVKFVETLKGLEKDGFLVIKKMQFNFNAVPIPIEEETERLQEPFYVDEDAYFYPAEHCKITVALSDSKSIEGVLLKEEAKHAIPAEAILSAIEEDEDVREQEEFYKDKIQLVSKLLQICTPEFLEVELRSPAHLVQNDDFRAGFDHPSILDTLKKKKVFTKVKDLTYKQTSSLMYLATVDYQNLCKFAEELHDEVEAQGEVYGFEIQKKILLNRLKEVFNQSPQENTFKVSEALLGSYKPENRTSRPAGISLTRPDKERPDIRYQFMRTMRALEKEKYFEISSVNFDFYAEPKQTSESKKRAIWGSDEPFEYYSPQHCQVALKLSTETKPSGSSSKSITVEDSRGLPKDEIYTCGNLTINITAATLKYKDNPEIDIQPGNQEIQLLIMLIKNHRVVKYAEIAKEIESTSFVSEDVGRAVGYIRKTLRDVLLQAGMNESEIKRMIVTIRKTGYKLVCPN